ncbi:MAG: hypothetical protein A4E51_00355 [Methanosaeta sp. PtaU1.Bin055]|nr:MAG: hypothetical protein A4E51_00355 [Methanosaeta sp. PtaU1.Bin055]
MIFSLVAIKGILYFSASTMASVQTHCSSTMMQSMQSPRTIFLHQPMAPAILAFVPTILYLSLNSWSGWPIPSQILVLSMAVQQTPPMSTLSQSLLSSV